MEPEASEDLGRCNRREAFVVTGLTRTVPAVVPVAFSARVTRSAQDLNARTERAADAGVRRAEERQRRLAERRGQVSSAGIVGDDRRG